MEEEVKVVSNYVYGSSGIPVGNGAFITTCNGSDLVVPSYSGYTSSYSSPKDTTELKLKCLLNKAEDLIVACLDSNRVMDQTAAAEFLTEWRKMK